MVGGSIKKIVVILPIAIVILLMAAGMIVCGYYLTRDPYDASRYSGEWIENSNDLKSSAKNFAQKIKGELGYFFHTPDSRGWFVIYGNSVTPIDRESLAFQMIYESKETPGVFISADEWKKLSEEGKNEYLEEPDLRIDLASEKKFW